MNLGTLLRSRRKELSLTLRAVAERTGVSEGFLSQVENSVKSPSLNTLVGICEALELDVGQLINQARRQESVYVVRRGEWDEVDLPHTGFATRRFVPPEGRAQVDSAILFLEPGRSLPVRKDARGGQEILCVLEGGLELTQRGQAVELGPGDAAHLFTDPEEQVVTNHGQDRAVVLWVGTI